MEERTLPRYPAGKRELIFGLLVLLFGTFTWNSILYGGFCLGFALGAVALTGCSFWYLLRCGFRPGKYEAALLILAAVIFAGFARSSDSDVKAGMLLMALFAVNLSFCRMAGQSRREPGGIASALDAPRAIFVLGVGSMSAAVRGLNDARKNAGTAGKRGGAAILGVLIALPVAAVLIVLLMRADAAFEGLMDMLPDTDWSEPLLSLSFGVFAGWILYSRGVGLKYAEKNGKEAKSFHGFSAITVNILLGTVCLIYAVYLLSQLAYLGGGFAGILPDGYTLAEYARRGFFEMAWLSFINLGLMCLAMGLVEKKAGAPALTRGLCLFLGLAALFLIAAASAKMLLYISGYGLTRKRVLTEIFMLWLGVTTILVSVWLFKLRLPYMKGAVICALILGCVTFWADVDTQVARYNVRAYQSGQLETIDMGHMGCLGDGALPYIKELTHDRDPEIASTAMDILENSYCSISDFRSWTYTESAARKAVDAD